jgi:hypothetical protein
MVSSCKCQTDRGVYSLPKLHQTQVQGLQDALERTTIPINKSRKNSGVGRTQVFGNIPRRNKGFGPASNNGKYPEIYRLLRELGNEIVPFKYDGIQLNHNYVSLPHVDKNNFGHSLTVSFGRFRGGYLIIDGRRYNTKMTPILFNGALLEHYNTPISGDRYSLVFFRSRSPQRCCCTEFM